MSDKGATHALSEQMTRVAILLKDIEPETPELRIFWGKVVRGIAETLVSRSADQHRVVAIQRTFKAIAGLHDQKTSSAN